MKALISPNETFSLPDSTIGIRIADVHPVGFEVAEPLFWLECQDIVRPETHYFDGTGIALRPVSPPPAPPAPPVPLTDGGPSVIAE